MSSPKPKQVASAIIEHNDKLFFQKRSATRKFLPNVWDMPGGHVDPGETVEEALAREIFEETGWKLTKIKTLLSAREWQLPNDQENPNREEFSFLVEVEGDLKHPKLEQGKSSEGRWFAKNEFEELIHDHADRDNNMAFLSAQLAYATLKHPLPQSFSGTVIDGEKVGRTIGFPTINLNKVPSRDQLEPGIYLTKVQLKSGTYDALSYFGPRYIFNETKDVLEAYIYDLDQDLYGQEAELKLTHYTRTPRDVSSLDELKELLENDKKTGLKMLDYLENRA